MKNEMCKFVIFFIYLFGVLRRFLHCTCHITTGSWKGRGNQYIQFIRVLYCKQPTNGKELPAFPLDAVPGTKTWPQRWEERVLPLCHHGPLVIFGKYIHGTNIDDSYVECFPFKNVIHLIGPQLSDNNFEHTVNIIHIMSFFKNNSLEV